MTERRHIYPLGDLIEHEIDGDDCVCGPQFEFPGDGGCLVIHHSLDGREHGEPDHDAGRCPIC